MRVVDPHVHFWNPESVAAGWLTHRAVGYAGDYRDLPVRFTPQTLKSISGDVDVVKCVHVEAIADDAIQEARWVDSISQSSSMPIGIVAFADLSADNFRDALAALRSTGRLRGIRQTLGVHANPAYAYAKRDYLRDSIWKNNVAELGVHGLLFDLAIYPSQAPDACWVVERNPNVMFVLNHAGMFVDRNSASGWRAWRDELRQLAKFPNVTVKISGLAMFDHKWTAESFRPYVLESIDAFGVERCMFASNFPIDGLHSKYDVLWHAYQEIVSGMSSGEIDSMFFNNAERVYRI